MWCTKNSEDDDDGDDDDGGGGGDDDSNNIHTLVSSWLTRRQNTMDVPNRPLFQT